MPDNARARVLFHGAVVLLAGFACGIPSMVEVMVGSERDVAGVAQRPAPGRCLVHRHGFRAAGSRPAATRCESARGGAPRDGLRLHGGGPHPGDHRGARVQREPIAHSPSRLHRQPRRRPGGVSVDRLDPGGEGPDAGGAGVPAAGFRRLSQGGRGGAAHAFRGARGHRRPPVSTPPSACAS